MKKLLTLTLAVSLVGISSAASIDWTVGGMNKVLKAYDGTTAANTTVYLIFADADSLASITDLDSESAFTTALSDITISTVSAGSDGKKPSTIKKTVANDNLTAGSSYPMASLYYSKDTEGNGYYRIAATTGTAYDPTVEGSSGDVSTSWSNMLSANWANGWTKPTDPTPPGPGPIPEPATGALALAGVALLFKRRRA